MNEPSHSLDDESLNHSLRRIRSNLVLQERIREIQSDLVDTWETHRHSANDGKPTGQSPAQKLHIEALASIAVLSDFHCSTSNFLAESGDHKAAHVWSLDEGILRAAFNLLQSVDMST